jgi:hypothetical protein
VMAVFAIFDIHRAAEYDQAAITIDVRFRIRLPVEVDETNAVPASTDQRIERAQRLGGDMLEDKDAGHAGGSGDRRDWPSLAAHKRAAK